MIFTVVLVVFIASIFTCKNQNLNNSIGDNNIITNEPGTIIDSRNRIVETVKTIYPRNPIIEGFVIKNVNIHADTDANSAVLGILEMFNRIELLANIVIGDINDYFNCDFWHKIKYNDIEGYIWQGTVDTDKQIFDLNGNTIVVYSVFANGRQHWIPNVLMVQLTRYTIFINDKTIVLPNFPSDEMFKKAKIIDGNLHLNYNYETYDEILARLDSRSARFLRDLPTRHYDYQFIVKPQNDQVYIVQIINRRHDKYIITDRITDRGNYELEFAGGYDVVGQYSEGDFTIEENGEIVAYRGTSKDIIVPEKIAGITVRSMDRDLFLFRPASVRLPPSIRFVYDDFSNRTRVPVIIDDNVDIKTYSSFDSAYNRNGRRGGTYIHGWNNDTRDYEWSFEPF